MTNRLISESNKGVESRYVLLILVTHLQVFEENDEIYRQLLSKKDSPDSVNSTPNETVKDDHKNCQDLCPVEVC